MKSDECLLVLFLTSAGIQSGMPVHVLIICQEIPGTPEVKTTGKGRGMQ